MNRPDTSNWPNKLSAAFSTRYPNAITAKQLVEALFKGWEEEQKLNQQQVSSSSQTPTSRA